MGKEDRDMLCQNCGKNEANVRYTQIINGVKKEMGLCDKCSNELGIGMNHIDFNMPINLSSFLGDFLQETDNGFLQEMMQPKTLMCEQCHMTYDEFASTGKFGCSNCYEVFSNKIDPLLKNLHASNKHTGRKIVVNKNEDKNNKNNKNNANSNTSNTNNTKQSTVGAELKSAQTDEIQELKQKLKIAIQEERYEDAAKIRDEIKKLES